MHNFQFFFRLEIRGQKAMNVIMKNPEFLTMAPGEMLHKKINVFNDYNIPV